jgi:hypothetical protein
MLTSMVVIFSVHPWHTPAKLYNSNKPFTKALILSIQTRN